MAAGARAVRRLWPDRNPLRRAADRIEAAVVGMLVVAFLAGAPLAADAAGHAVYAIGSRTAHAQRAAWRQVPAVLLAAAPDPGYGGYPVTAQARWAAPDGTRHTGKVPAPPDAQVGSTVMVWVDAAGRPTGPPLRFGYVRGRAVLTAMLAVLLAGFIVLGAGCLCRGALDRRRLAGWTAEWQATEPQWTRRRLVPASWFPSVSPGAERTLA